MEKNIEETINIFGEDNSIENVSQLILKNNNNKKRYSSENKNKYNSHNYNDVILHDIYKNNLTNNFNNSIYNSKYSISQRSNGLNDIPQEYNVKRNRPHSNFNLSKEKEILKRPNIENSESKIKILKEINKLKESNNKLKEPNNKLILDKNDLNKNYDNLKDQNKQLNDEIINLRNECEN